MCLKLYLPKDSLLSIDQGPDSHKLWGHVCDWEEDRERRSRTPGWSRPAQTYGRVACDRKDMSSVPSRAAHMPFYEVLRL